MYIYFWINGYFLISLLIRSGQIFLSATSSLQQHSVDEIVVSPTKAKIISVLFSILLSMTTLTSNNWRAQCKNGLSDDFGPPFTKSQNYTLSWNVTVAKWIASCSQHIVLVIWIEFPPKLYQVTLLLARKEKLPKCQEIPIITAGGKKQFCCCPWWMWLAAMDYLDRKRCSRNFLHSKMTNFVLPVTLSSATFSD